MASFYKSRGSFTDGVASLTLSLPSSKSTFPQPFKKKFISEVVRIGWIIIFHLNKLLKTKLSTLCGVIFLARQQGNLKLVTLGGKGLKSFENTFVNSDILFSELK